jgi:hypothetical protein
MRPTSMNRLGEPMNSFSSQPKVAIRRVAPKIHRSH